MTKREAELMFREDILPAVRAAYEQDVVPDYIARSEEWNNFTDGLCKERLITVHQYETWSHPRICGR